MKEVIYNYDNLKENEIDEIVIRCKGLIINNSHLDKDEIEGNYIIKMININNVENILIDSISLNEINKIIVEEMLDVINEYKKYIIKFNKSFFNKKI